MGFLDIFTSTLKLEPPGGWNAAICQEDRRKAENEWLWLIYNKKMEPAKAQILVLKGLFEKRWHCKQ